MTLRSIRGYLAGAMGIALAAVPACYEAEVRPPVPIGSSIAAATKQSRPTGSRGRAELVLRDAATGSGVAEAFVGDTLTVEAFVDPGGDAVTGAVLFLSLDANSLELVPDDVIHSGPRPFEQAEFMGGDVYHNDMLGDEIGDPLANGLPHYQLRYVENVAPNPFGDQPSVSDPGVLARFRVRLIAERSSAILLDEVSPSGSEMGYFIAEKPGTNLAFRRLDTFEIRAKRIEPRVVTETPGSTQLVVTLLRAGAGLVETEVLVSRAISGKASDYANSGVTDDEGTVSIDLSESGYYTIVARSNAGEPMGTWTSVPINTGYRHHMTYVVP